LPVRDAIFYTSSLLELHRLTGPSERKAAWRQAVAALARAATEDGPGPLEGVQPSALLAGVRAALQAGLVDDLDWLAPAAAGVALYELASALPVGPEQRELGRRVLARVLGADAETFVEIARRMALGGGRGLASPGMRARVVLVTELPIAEGVADGPLALALASRRDLARDWIDLPSTASLHARRLAARLLERAAREGARRAAQGDDHSLRFLRAESVIRAWNRLLADRESLVWRHVAVARGLLAPWSPAYAAGITADLAATLSPTEWRRAATSAAAWVAVSPEKGLELVSRVVSQGLVERDPGVAGALLWGVPRAAEAEPEAAMEVVGRVMDVAGPGIGEAVIDLRWDLGDSPITERATLRAAALLSQRGQGARSPADDGAEALALEVTRDLTGGERDEPVRAQIAQALVAFATEGAKGAHARARNALAAAQASMDALEAVSRDEDGAEGRSGAIARRTSLAVLRDLDLSLLEHDVLAALLSLGPSEAARGSTETLDGLRDRLTEWILAREETPLTPDAKGEANSPHPTLSTRRLRALLHVADGDLGDEDQDSQREARLKRRSLRITRALLERFDRDPPSPVRRTIAAALARSLDALVRAKTLDPMDALLAAARKAGSAVDLRTLSEASMSPELEHVLERYATFAEAVSGDLRKALAAYEAFTRDMALEASARSEALHAVLVRLSAALQSLEAAASLRALESPGKSEAEAVSALEAALGALSQLTIGARGRLDPDRGRAAPPTGLRPLSIAVARVLSGADSALREAVVAAALDDLLAGVPKSIALLVSSAVWRMQELPRDGRAPESRAGSRSFEALPGWISARRTIGGFYVVRPLSTGAVGSVFVATRVEDKGEEGAEQFALKVPEYSAIAARSVSEAEFLKMFREEASALMVLPQHPNLARFVTFDAGSKPKPILVMELVEGTTLERAVEAGGLGTHGTFRMLDDVLQGLEAMHAIGVGHLDLKPSNVVLRRNGQAVLVDFGLAGRHIRPGCATGPYGAPEVWGALEGRTDLAPAKADVYAFGCIAFEALTGKVLFQADTELAQIALHLAHDGFPPLLRAFAANRAMSSLAEILFSTLRRDPADRPTVASLRKDLARIAPSLSGAAWPLAS
jgi:hypothetical protein